MDDHFTCHLINIKARYFSEKPLEQSDSLILTTKHSKVNKMSAAQPEKGEAANVSGNPISKDQAQQSASRADKGLDGGSM